MQGGAVNKWGVNMAAKDVDPWKLAQGQLQNVLDDHSFKNWFSPTSFDSYSDGCLVVKVPSEFFASWLRDHYLDAIGESVRAVIPDFQEVRFVPAGELAETIEDGQARATMGRVSARKAKRAVQTVPGLNQRYTFDRFVIGAGNRFAHAAAKAVVENPARAYNPLFLYGATGLGKTHLMQAIGREVLETEPEANVVFISSEQFTNQLIESIAKKATKRFRAKYRKVDYLLIDDVQFIAGKEATQEEFFHTFNELFDSHKQIVLSSDRAPKELQDVEERLISRFEWGLVTDIQAPDMETRIAILQNKAADENLQADPEVIAYIASNVTSNIRELEGALITVLAYGKLTQQKIDLPLVQQVLGDLIGSAKIKPITVEGIQKTVAEHFDVRISDIRGRSRQRQYAFPRQLSMYLAKSLIPNVTLSELGEAFGGKDHTTVLYACQKIHKQEREDEATRQLLNKLEKSVRQQ